LIKFLVLYDISFVLSIFYDRPISEAIN